MEDLHPDKPHLVVTFAGALLTVAMATFALVSFGRCDYNVFMILCADAIVGISLILLCILGLSGRLLPLFLILAWGMATVIAMITSMNFGVMVVAWEECLPSAVMLLLILISWLVNFFNVAVWIFKYSR